MSKVVDQRVVEMQFDNRHFEKNVHTTMSTLDKFKEKLNFRGATKGLDEVNAAAKRVDMNGLGKGVEVVSAKFSALQVIGITALTNITNQAINTGKQLIKSLSVDQLSAGWSKYEQKTANVQTLVNSTGKSVEEINQYLDKLMWFSDETSYSFTDMTSALAQMTSSGGDIDKLMPMITGIANATAFAGKGATEFAHTIRNLAQSYQTGFLNLMDMKSLDLMGTSSKQLKESFISVAESLGKIKKGEVTLANFNESLKDKWADTEVIEKALSKFSELSEAAYAAVDAGQFDTAAEAIEALSKDYDELAVRAFKSAQEAKTFAEAIDATKDAVSSGWLQSYEIIFGNYEEAKKLWTDLANTLWDVFASGAEKRNAILSGAFVSKWDMLTEKIESAGLSTEKFSEVLEATLNENGVSVDELVEKYGSLANAIKAGKVKAEHIAEALRKFLGIGKEAAEVTDKVTMSVEELNEVVKKVINGEFGNGADRIKALTEAGYDYATVQNKVNELLGSSVRHNSKLTEEQLKNADSLVKLTNAQLKNQGYTDEQIEALRELAEVADGADTSISQLIKDLERPSGRELLIDSFKNMWEGILEVVELVKEAWADVFGEKDIEEQSDAIYGMIEKFHELTESMTFTEETAERFRNILTGVFSALDLSWSLASVSLLGGLKILNEVFKLFGTDLGKVLEYIANQVTKLNKWVEEETIFGSTTKYLDLAKIIEAIYLGIKNVVTTFLGLERISKIIDRFKEAFSDIFSMFDGNPLKILKTEYITSAITKFFNKIVDILIDFDQAEDLGAYLAEGIINGFIAAISTFSKVISTISTTIFESFADFFGWNDEFREAGIHVISGLIEGMSSGIQGLIKIASQVFKVIYDTITTLFGIQSPSRVMMVVGGFIIAGLLLGLSSKNGEIGAVINGIGSTIYDGFLKLADLVSGVLKKINFGKLVSIALTGGLILTIKNLTDVLEIFATPLEGFGKLLSGLGGAIKSFGNAVADVTKANVWKQRSKAILNAAIGIAILVGAIYVLSKLDIDPWALTGYIIAIGVLAGILVALALACDKLSKVGDFGLTSASIMMIAGALLMLSFVFKLLSGIQAEEVPKTIAMFVAMVIGLFSILTVLTKLTDKLNLIDKGGIKQLGKIFTRLAWSLLIMIGVIKLASMLDGITVLKGITVITLIGAFYAALIASMSIMPKESTSIEQFGKMSLKLSISLLLMIGVIKLASKLSLGEVLRGSAVIAAVGVLFAGIIKITQILDKDETAIDKAGKTILGISVAMLLMTLAVKMVSGLSVSELAKGVTVIYAIGVLFAVLIAVSKFSGQHAAKAGLMLIEMAGALLIITTILLILKDMDPAGLGKALGIITWISAIFAGLIAITNLAKHADKVKGMLITLTVAIGVLSLAIIAMSFLDTKKVLGAAGALSAVIGMFGLLMYASSFLKTGKKTWLRSLATIAVMTLVVYAIGHVIRTTSELEPDKAIGAAVGIGTLLLALSGSLFILSNSKSLGTKNLTRMYGTLAVLLVVATAIGGLIKGLGTLDPASAISGAVAIGVLLNSMAVAFNTISKSKSISAKTLPQTLWTIGVLTLVAGAFSIMIASLNKCNPSSSVGNAVAIGILLNALSVSFNILTRSKTITKSALPGILQVLGLLSLVAPILSICIGGLKDCNPSSSIGNAIAIGILLNALAVALNIVSRSGVISQSALPGILASLTMLTIVTAVIAEVIKGLSQVNPASAIGSAVALSILIATLSVALIPLSMIGTLATNAIAGALALTSMVVPLVAFAYALSNIPDLSETKNTVIILAQLMTAMTLLLVPLTLIGVFAINAILGAVALTSMVIPIIAFGKALAGIPDLSAARESITILTDVITRMSLLMIPLTLVGAFAPAAIAGVAVLVGFISALTGLVIGIGALMQIPDLEEFISTGINMLIALANGLGRVIGAFITGFSEEVMSMLPRLGICLSLFIAGAMPFIQGVKMVDESVLTGVKNLASAILYLTGAELMNSFLNFGGGGLMKLATQLSQFISIIYPALLVLSDIDPAIVNSTKTLSEAVLNLTKSELIGCISNFLGASLNLDSFAKQMSAYGDGVKSFYDSIKDANIDATVVEAAANAGKLMVELQKSISPLNGVVQAFTGQKNLGDFGSQLKLYGQGLVGFSKAVSAEGAINPEAIESAANAGKLMTELQKSVEASHGVFQWLAGNKSLDTFGADLKKYGEGVAGFSKAVSGEGKLDAKAIEAAQNVGKVMAEVQASIPKNTIGDGKIDIADFGGKIKKYGESIADYSDSISDIDVEKLRASTEASKSLVSVAKSASGIDTESIENFGSVSVIGDAMKNYGESVKDLNAEVITSTISSAFRLKTFIASLSGLDSSGVTNFKIGDIGKTMKSYGETVKDVNPFTMSASIAVAERLRNFIASLVSLDSSGLSNFKVGDVGNQIRNYSYSVGLIQDYSGVLSSISVGMKLRSFIASLVGLDSSGVENFKVGNIGNQIKNYALAVAGIDFVSASSSLSVAAKLRNFVSSLVDFDGSGISRFNVSKLGSSLRSYGINSAGIPWESVSASISAATRLRNFISSLSGMDTSGVSAYVDAINKLGKVSVSSVVKAMSGASDKLKTAGANLITSLTSGMKSKTSTMETAVKTIATKAYKAVDDKKKEFASAGKAFAEQLAKGISDNKSKAVSKVKSMASDAADAADDYEDDFYSAGQAMADGLADGISTNSYKAVAKAAAMASAAYKAAKEALDINSPSKIFRSLGYSVPEGFAMGIDRLSYMAKQSSIGMTDAALDGVKGAISRISDFVNSDIDSQPVIRPVLDLSAVATGAGTINGMFGMKPSVGVMSNVRAINSMMRNQNGSNYEVVSAIEKLRKDLGNINPGNTYQINGITYDDGSGISDAVKTLVRAAKVERRI